MADKSEPLTDNDAPQDIENDNGDSPESVSEPSRQDIFEETFEKLMNGFGEACEAEGVEIAVAIAKHPQLEEPIVFYRAPHIVEAGNLMAEILRQIKGQVFADLDTEPR